MKWTSEPPQESGYYWWRRDKNMAPSIKYLMWQGCLCELLPGEKNHLIVLEWGGEFIKDEDPSAWGGEWAGPIPEPAEE